MFPPVFDILTAAPDVTTLVQTRVYGSGQAVQDTSKPYVVWSVPAGAPENTLSELPTVDRQVVQVDCYSKEEKQVKQLAIAVRNALEPHCHMTQHLANEREFDTKLFRVALQFDYFLNR